jgi:Xaa-Pro aminopeptidase
MLTAEGCAARRQRLWDALPSPCDILIIADPQHLVYFANFAPSPFTFRTSDATALLILEPDKATLVADNLQKPFTDEAHVDEVVAPAWYEGKRSAPVRRAVLFRSALAALEKIPGYRIGLEISSVPTGVAVGLSSTRQSPMWADLDPIIRPLRRSKDPDELDLIVRSIRAGEAGMAAALAEVRPGMTEFQAYQAIEQACLATAGERAVVYGDFVSGPRSQDRLGPPTHRAMDRGDLLILDFSVVLHGYRGDFANTLAVGGPSDRQRALADACLEAMAAGEAVLKPGVSGRDVYAAVRGAFAARGLADQFKAHAGHGIGLSHPEPPYFVPESDEVVEEGDVVTLEPGLYGEDFGGMRFERNYLVTADGFETLTKHALTLGR